MSLRAPLPAFPIPLREGEPEIQVELQPPIKHAYVAGGHDDIDYSRPPEPPLRGENARWSDYLLSKAGKR